MRSWSELLHRFKVSAICIWCRKWMKDCTAIAIALKVFIYNPLAMKMCLWLKKWSMSHEALCSSSRKVPWHTMTFELSWKLSTKFFQVHLEFDHQSSPPYHPLTIPGSLGAPCPGESKSHVGVAGKEVGVRISGSCSPKGEIKKAHLKRWRSSQNADPCYKVFENINS
jgi:hypothetical protein